MKEGKKQEAEEAKTKTGEFKQKSQDLQQLLKEKEESLLNILYQIPNIPADIVKAGSSADDNEVVYQSCDTFEMGTEALPHWELAKNTI